MVRVIILVTALAVISVILFCANMQGSNKEAAIEEAAKKAQYAELHVGFGPDSVAVEKREAGLSETKYGQMINSIIEGDESLVCALAVAENPDSFYEILKKHSEECEQARDYVEYRYDSTKAFDLAVEALRNNEAICAEVKTELVRELSMLYLESDV